MCRTWQMSSSKEVTFHIRTMTIQVHVWPVEWVQSRISRPIIYLDCHCSNLEPLQPNQLAPHCKSKGVLATRRSRSWKHWTQYMAWRLVRYDADVTTSLHPKPYTVTFMFTFNVYSKYINADNSLSSLQRRYAVHFRYWTICCLIEHLQTRQWVKIQ